MLFFDIIKVIYIALLLKNRYKRYAKGQFVWVCTSNAVDLVCYWTLAVFQSTVLKRTDGLLAAGALTLLYPLFVFYSLLLRKTARRTSESFDHSSSIEEETTKLSRSALRKNVGTLIKGARGLEPKGSISGESLMSENKSGVSGLTKSKQ